MRYFDYLKKMFVLFVAALSISIVHLSPAKADATANYYLSLIANYTNQILQIIQNPANFAGLAVSWMQQDTGDNSITTKIQQDLATVGATYTASQALIKAAQKQTTADIFGKKVSDFSGNPAPILLDLPDVNALSYASLVGVPPVENQPVDFYAYVKNAAGFNIAHPIPNSSWEGDIEAKAKYSSYYNSIVAIQSFSAYVISQLAVNNLLKVNEARDKLINTASSSSFIAQIATEELGRVLRQILLFESQNFVLNAEVQKSINDMVAAQAMTNTLLIKMNEANEHQLLSEAKGETGSAANF